MIRTDAQLSVSRFTELIAIPRRTYTYRLAKHRAGDPAKGPWPAPVVDRIEPVELALAGLSDCIIGTIAMHAMINGINIEHISATVRAPLNLQVLLGIDGLDKRDQTYGKIAIEVEIEGPDLTEKQRIFLSEQTKRSPVFNLVALAHEMDTTLKIRR